LATDCTKSVARCRSVAEAAGYSVVREYVGHAIGTEMHESPQVPNYWPGTPGPTLKEGMVFAIEPMVNVGTYETYLLDDGWSVMTRTVRSRRTSSTPSPSPTTDPKSLPS
jgi:methionine aminopeptidase